MMFIENLKIGLVVFARFNSSRLPGKALLEIEGRPLIGHVIDRARKLGKEFPLVIATSNEPSDDVIENFARVEKIKIFRGSLDNVLDRAIKCCEKFNFNSLARICGDRPFHCYKTLKKLINIHISGNYDLTTNNLVKTFPKGLTTEIISLKSLKKVYSLTDKKFDHEHITNFMYQNCEKFKIYDYRQKQKEWKSFNLSVDTRDDFNKTKWIIANLDCMPFEASIEKIMLLNKIWQNQKSLES